MKGGWLLSKLKRKEFFADKLLKIQHTCAVSQTLFYFSLLKTTETYLYFWNTSFLVYNFRRRLLFWFHIRQCILFLYKTNLRHTLETHRVWWARVNNWSASLLLCVCCDILNKKFVCCSPFVYQTSVCLFGAGCWGSQGSSVACHLELNRANPPKRFFSSSDVSHWSMPPHEYVDSITDYHLSLSYPAPTQKRAVWPFWPPWRNNLLFLFGWWKPYRVV